MKKCIECGNELPDDACFCSSCGKAVHNGTRPQYNIKSFTHSFPDETKLKEKEVNEVCATTNTATDIQPIEDNGSIKNTRTVGYVIVFCVFFLVLSFFGSWANEEWQFRKYVSNHDYQSLSAIIIKPDSSMSKKERAIESIIQAGDTDAAKAIETLLVSNDLKQEVEKYVWQTLTKYKLNLPGDMDILTKGKTFANTSDIQQYYLSVIPIEQEITLMKQLGSNLAQEENINALIVFLGNTRDIISGLPEKEKTAFSRVKTNVDAWSESLQKTQEAAGKIQEAQEKINTNNRIINDRLNKMHSLVMTAYKVRNVPMNTTYMDEDLKSAYAESFKQTDATVRAMTNDLSGGDPTKRSLVYLDMAMRFGDPDTNKQVASWGGEISEQAKELSKNREDYSKILSDYDVGRLNRNILRLKQSTLDLLLGRNPITHK
jgi:hypothetical protein